MNVFGQLSARAASLLDSRAVGTPAQNWLGRPFSSQAGHRIMIYRTSGEIARSQIEPFFRAAPDLERRGVEIRCRPISDFLEGDIGQEADVVVIQPWFTETDGLPAALDRFRNRYPDARLVFLDSYAHNDLRLGRAIEPYVELYFKKSLFRNRRDYLVPRRGDTNLTEYYGDLYGRPEEVVDWQVPESILDRLRLFPNFLTHTRFTKAFTTGRMPPRAGRTIDVQSRLGVRGSPWYEAMRRDAQTRIEAIPGLSLSPPGKLRLKAFMAELANSKLCFSPFGYGEICWRDIEAFQTGAVLVKPDMSHLETLPDLYEAGVTYLPVRWDFADLEEVVTAALADEERMAAIAAEAWRRCADYLVGRHFVTDLEPLLPAGA